MKETLIDIETYSEVDIGKCGLYRYATDPSFEILLVAWATDEGDGFGETRCADLASGEHQEKKHPRIGVWRAEEAKPDEGE